jgi:sarcosine/dimethylglycine N-methyltransferase
VTGIQIQTQYSTDASRQAIEQALVAAGKDPGHLRQADLALLEDFHTMGRIATAQLADLVEITPDDEVLDAGSGIGGTARYVAGRSRCHVAAVDLTGEYCQTARWLNQLAGLDDRISVRQADVTDLPFQDATFTLMFSQHVQMNVADKAPSTRRRAGSWPAAAGWLCGTSPPARTANPTSRCPGPTGPDTVT